MIYKCPLCLQTLTDESELVRVCREHPPKENEQPVSFKCSEENLQNDIFCTQDGWCNDNIESGVFLRHVGCPAKNPFWNDIKGVVELPGSDNLTNFDYTTENGSPITRQVNHWEIGMLRRMPAAEEMWFPMMLLRATAKEENNEGRKVGALVGLAGNLRVGKSVIAMQAMEYEGYIAPEDHRSHIEVRGFLFSRMRPGTKVSANPFLANLYINNLMTMNKGDIFPLPGTDRMPGDLKVAFIKPTEGVLTMFPDNSSLIKIGPEPKKGLRGLVKKFVNSSKDIIVGIKEVLAENNHHHPYWYTVAFYDASGEAYVYGDMIPDEIERAADKIAIVVDGTEVFGVADNNGVENSMAVANDRIRKVHDKRLKGALVVTKLDLIFDRLPEPEQEQVRDIAENLEGAPEEAREMLAKWLSQRRHDDNAKELLQRLKLVERVFFVWTEDLPTMTETGEVRSSATQPHSYGLAKFVCWCLDKDWTHIVHVK